MKTHTYRGFRYDDFRGRKIGWKVRHRNPPEGRVTYIVLDFRTAADAKRFIDASIDGTVKKVKYCPDCLGFGSHARNCKPLF